MEVSVFGRHEQPVTCVANSKHFSGIFASNRSLKLSALRLCIIHLQSYLSIHTETNSYLFHSPSLRHSCTCTKPGPMWMCSLAAKVCAINQKRKRIERNSNSVNHVEHDAWFPHCSSKCAIFHSTTFLRAFSYEWTRMCTYTIRVYKCIYTDIMSKSDNRQIRYALWTHTFTIYLQHGSAESLQIISSCCLRNESEWHMISNIIKYRILKWMKFSAVYMRFVCIKQVYMHRIHTQLRQIQQWQKYQWSRATHSHTHTAVAAVWYGNWHVSAHKATLPQIENWHYSI